MPRYILHCDLDCFFAAVEARDDPELRGKPLIIGADPKEGKGRGVVSTCSYEAREYGIHSAMPISQAYKLCSHAIFRRPSHKKYRPVSDNVMNILKKYSDVFQKVSIDEAYLDITDKCENFEDAKKIAHEIKNEVQERLGITVSIGCSSTKSIAKIASDHNKPNGICVVKDDEVKDFLKNLHITRIPGIGKKTKIHFYKNGIKKIGDLIDIPLYKLMKMFGKHGKWIWRVINGLDKRKVKQFSEGRKSISKERTFYHDTDEFDVILEKLEDINIRIHKTLIKEKISYRTVTLKIRFEDFETFTRSKSISYPICNHNKALKIILNLYKEFSEYKRKIRLIGIKFSNFERTNKIRQTNLCTFCDIYS
ncbi:MAG: DNA polymerase IV [Candidatus Lokiarchaeota archaeon]|nr:DNA polymerase IV [Candidatus Lokiarchaeota archaeon]MBD3201505.1 DNA polymerase IV [Candidatus Lokiarchaeota archaeon]